MDRRRFDGMVSCEARRSAPFAGEQPGERASADSQWDARQLGDLCHDALERNWREGERDGIRYGYTAPSAGRYPWQFYWDSCFAAIVWRRFDPTRARAELETLLAAATTDGFIGHTIFWAEPVSPVRALFYNIRSRADYMTATIQPPLLAWAWRVAVGDPSENPVIVRHHDWVERERAIDGDGLLWLVQPDESGLDASPKFDSAFGWQADGLPGFPLLVRPLPVPAPLLARTDVDQRGVAAVAGNDQARL
jgi:hypothetical protein